jgi:hypothetical protein
MKQNHIWNSCFLVIGNGKAPGRRRPADLGRQPVMLASSGKEQKRAELEPTSSSAQLFPAAAERVRIAVGSRGQRKPAMNHRRRLCKESPCTICSPLRVGMANPPHHADGASKRGKRQAMPSARGLTLCRFVYIQLSRIVHFHAAHHVTLLEPILPNTIRLPVMIYPVIALLLVRRTGACIGGDSIWPQNLKLGPSSGPRYCAL